MDKPCFLAVVLLLGGFVDTALMLDASTESFLTSTNVTSAATAEPVTPQHKTDAPTPTAAPSKSSSGSGAKQQDSTEEDSREKNSGEDEKTQLGKEGLTCLILLFPHSTRFFMLSFHVLWKTVAAGKPGLVRKSPRSSLQPLWSSH